MSLTRSSPRPARPWTAQDSAVLSAQDAGAESPRWRTSARRRPAGAPRRRQREGRRPVARRLRTGLGRVSRHPAAGASRRPTCAAAGTAARPAGLARDPRRGDRGRAGKRGPAYGRGRGRALGPRPVPEPVLASPALHLADSAASRRARRPSQRLLGSASLVMPTWRGRGEDLGHDETPCSAQAATGIQATGVSRRRAATAPPAAWVRALGRASAGATARAEDLGQPRPARRPWSPRRRAPPAKVGRRADPGSALAGRHGTGLSRRQNALDPGFTAFPGDTAWVSAVLSHVHLVSIGAAP